MTTQACTAAGPVLRAIGVGQGLVNTGTCVSTTTIGNVHVLNSKLIESNRVEIENET